MSKPSVAMKAVIGCGIFAVTIPVMAHIRYLDLNQNLRIRELKPAGIALVGNNVPISDPAYWNTTYQTPQASTEVWGSVTGSYASGTWSTSVLVKTLDSSSWTDGLRTDPDGGANALADSHTFVFANFHLKDGAHVTISVSDALGGTGTGLNPSFTLYSGLGVYGGHDDAAIDPKSPTSGIPPVKIQNAKDDGTAVDWKGSVSPYRNTLTNTGGFFGQCNTIGSFSMGDSTGNWSVMNYVTSVTGTMNPDGSWTGNSNTNTLVSYYLPPGDYVIAVGGNAQPPSYATPRSGTTTSINGVLTGQTGTLSLSVVMVDTDNDGVGDTSDAFPTNPAETLDTDNDGTGNNADLDDDDDGVPDYIDADPLNPAINSEITLPLNSTFKGSSIKEDQSVQ